MSLTTVEHAPARAASRRAVVRAAAWTSAAVTVVVATPDVAAASGGLTGSAVSVGIVRDTGAMTVVWDITVTPSVALAAGTLSVTFGGIAKTETLDVTSPSAWSGSSTTTRTYPAAVAPGEPVRLTATFGRSANGSGTASATFAATGYTGNLPVAAAY